MRGDLTMFSLPQVVSMACFNGALLLAARTGNVQVCWLHAVFAAGEGDIQACWLHAVIRTLIQAGLVCPSIDCTFTVTHTLILTLTLTLTSRSCLSVD